MTDKTEAQPEALRLELHQECTDFATSLRSAANVVQLRGQKAPPSFLKAADLFEQAASEIQQLTAENARLLPTIEDDSQEWAKCDPAIAFHLIDRHSDNWADAGKMMTEFADAKAEVKLKALRDELTTQTNRAATAEQQVSALTQRLDMANQLNTDARNQLAKLSARQAAPDWIEELAQSWDECMYDAPGEMIDIGASIRKAASRAAPPPPEREPKCWCETCRPVTLSDMRMVLCPDCGNKRCPKATHHDNACTNSNAPGQPGSSWEHVKPHGATND